MSDFDLARSLGHNAHRLSIEWSRIEPQPGEWNEEALEHYAAVIAALRQRQIEPIVTLHHFTNPAWLARNGVNVLGYLYWTLMDNYEWTSGREACFGLAGR